MIRRVYTGPPGLLVETVLIPGDQAGVMRPGSPTYIVLNRVLTGRVLAFVSFIV